MLVMSATLMKARIRVMKTGRRLTDVTTLVTIEYCSIIYSVLLMIWDASIVVTSGLLCEYLALTAYMGGGWSRSGTVGGKSPGLLLLGFTEKKHSKARPTQERCYTTRVVRH